MEPEPGTDVDWPIRLAAFNALAVLVRIHGDVLPWAVIAQGFNHAGTRFLFANRSKGIFRPAGMRDAALSVKTTVPRSGRPKYDDIETDDAFLYAFQANGPDYYDNRFLRRAIELRTPLVYFYPVGAGLYRPLWPTYASSTSDPESVSLTLEPSDALFAPGAQVSDPVMRTIVRRYATVQAKKRLHQDMFRGEVLRAYGQRCTICRFPRRELLDAAHILPDHDARGAPVISNGLALCRLHHGAYDTHLIGIRADLTIEVSPKLKAERDGPTLELGLKAFDGEKIHVPRRQDDRPNVASLEERYELFRRAG